MRFVLLLLPSLVLAQTWTPIDSLNRQLPASITVFEDASIPAYLVRADPADTTWSVRALLSATGGDVLTGFAESSNALAAINGGYFGGGSSFSLVASEGVVLVPNIKAVTRGPDTYFPTRSAFGIVDGIGEVQWVYDVDGVTYAYPSPSPNREGEAPQAQPDSLFPAGGVPWMPSEAIGGGPVLLRDGMKMITDEAEVFFGSGINAGGREPRTGIGVTGAGEILLMTVDGRSSGQGATLDELADLFLSAGAFQAMNLDGGGSSTMVVGGGLLNRPANGGRQRSIPTALVLAPGDGFVPPDPNEFIFDTGDACCYGEIGPWIESANTPFIGTTKARLNEVGDGSDRAVFTFDGLPAGTYQLDAWWIPSSNRALDTPYTVHHGGQETTIRVDQSDAGTLGQWNPLGTFELAAGDSVVVRDDALGTADPTFVCVDALRLTRLNTTSAEGETPRRPRFAVYPTPNAGRFTIETTEPGWSGHLYDALGRLVHRFEAARPGLHPLDLDLPSGLYLVRLEQAGDVAQQTVVIRR
ncbi:MAG: phosphodiester glycosidase family protein [Bacteroidota bacterium]